MNRCIFACAAVAAALALPFAAAAQTPQSTTYDVKTINFDLWCQEVARIDPDRCDKRLPEDEQNFEAFRGTIEKYELSHLKDKQKEYNFDQNLLHKDPIDNPLNQKQSAPTATTKNNP